MMRREPKLIDARSVLRGSIPHISIPAIPGIAKCKATHESISNDLGDNRGAPDGMNERIAINDCVVFTP
jgi:hypothetical protein